MAKRLSWGFWSESKLALLEDYLAGFLTACKQPGAAVYLDAFAGEGRGLSRMTGEEFNGSARIGAQATANGFDLRFTALRFIELRESRAHQIEADLTAEFPGRDIKVIAGDCNLQIDALLDSIPSGLRWAPTFAFLDPFGVELNWATVRAISDFKRSRKYKVELFMLFQTPGIMRIAGLTEERAADGWEEMLTNLFGCEDWLPIVRARRDGLIEPKDAREAFANLMRWRLVHELGYAYTHILQFFNTKNAPVYHMVFATDNKAGDAIMGDVYDAAAKRNENMRDELRARDNGALSLFPASDTLPKYRSLPPVEPDNFLEALLDDKR